MPEDTTNERSGVEIAEETRPEHPPADETLVAAVALARGALEEITATETIGEPAGHTVEGEHVVSLLFDCTMDGYAGWRWTVTLARVDAESDPTVLEAELVPGETALVAPEWVPWAERLAAIHAGRPAEAETGERASGEQQAAPVGESGDGVPGEDDVNDEDVDDDDVDDEGEDVDDDLDDDDDIDDDEDDIDGVDIDGLASLDVHEDEPDESESEPDDGRPERFRQASPEHESLDDEAGDSAGEPER